MYFYIFPSPPLLPLSFTHFFPLGLSLTRRARRSLFSAPACQTVNDSFEIMQLREIWGIELDLIMSINLKINSVRGIFEFI